MGIYTIQIDKKAKEEIIKIFNSGNKSDIKRLERIYLELSENPRIGIGKPERLKHFEGEIWSRQINKKDRLVYEIFESKVVVFIISALGHYKDK